MRTILCMLCFCAALVGVVQAVSYVPGLVPLTDGEGLYNGTNTRPVFYDALAPPIGPGLVKVNVMGASTADLFRRGLEVEATDPDVAWGDCGYGRKNADTWANPKHKVWGSCDRDGFADPDIAIYKGGHVDATTAEEDAAMIRQVMLNAFNRWSSLKQFYFVDEGWMGYYGGGKGKKGGDPGEPGGYMHGQAIKSVVLDEITVGQRFVSWGVYLWANGLGPDEVIGGLPGRSDGLEWTPFDFGGDGLHVNEQGARKQAQLFIAAALADPVMSQWYDGQ